MSEIVHLLSTETGLTESLVRNIMKSAPGRYKEYAIPKRSGGVRQIAQPAREVKLLQRALVATVLKKLPIHNSATAYRTGMSIRDNALPHAGSGPILKLDFRDFFPSIKSHDWVLYCRENKCLADDEDIQLTASLLFQRQSGYRSLRLAVGAPSSPILSNIIMYRFDSVISEEVLKDRVVYTRYADDLTFSAPRTGFLNGVLKIVSKTLRGLHFPSLDINEDKTTYVTSKFHRTVTGLTITNDGKVTIGRDKKRLLSASVHRAKLLKLSSDSLRSLAGHLAYVNSVEPGFIIALRVKYGDMIINFIQSQVEKP